MFDFTNYPDWNCICSLKYEKIAMFYDFEDDCKSMYVLFHSTYLTFFEILSSGEVDKTASVTLNYFKEFQVIFFRCSVQVVM